MIRFIRKTLNPERYHGKLRDQRASFFEGWYYKIVDVTETHRYAFIPGIFWSSQPHSFVQVLDGGAAEANYHEFPTDAFWAAEDSFDIRVDDNRFSGQEMVLRIDDVRQQIKGAIRFHDTTPWPVTVAAPGIMGWYAWVPFMECYHGVVSLDHTLSGSLTIDGREIDFTGGRGYIEKDWGRAFPEAWIWFQSNHFESPGTSLTGSIAIIPWLWTAFPGFIIGLWHERQLYRFATYTGAKTERLQVTEKTIDWVVSDRKFRLEMFVTQGSGSTFGLLKGPDTVAMGKRVAETLSATVQVSLTEKKGNGRVIFEGTGRHAGLEVHEVEARLLKMIE
ncbi:MAG: tocopherol cyclase family protein [Chloroflexota bacterium]